MYSMNLGRKVLTSLATVTSVFILLSCSTTQTDSEQRSDPNAVQVPDGYTVEMVAGPDLVDYPMFGIVEETGKLFLFESTGNVYEKSEDAIKDPKFRINMLEDTDGDGVYDKSTIYADKIGFPQGGVFYKGSLYASSAPDLLKLTDTDGDGVADKREVLLSGWTLNVNANSLVGPSFGPDGWLYMTNAIMGFDVHTQEGVHLKGETSRVWRVRPDGSGLEWVGAGGMNNPVELTFTEAGEPIGTMTYFTNPKAGQRDALIYWTEGGVYPKPNANITRDKLPRTGDLLPVIAKYSRVSPAGIHRYRNTTLGEDFKDNLFSAQFNTHRVLRHKVTREGASFRVEDDVFFWKDDEDFHPTDVFEDADGSMLIINTGGWFIKGCPLSQVSKPEIEGAVYRVKKKGAKKTDDAYGNSIAWSSLEPSALAAYIEDPRPFVRDRAANALVDQGATSVEALTALLRKAQSADTRTRVVFTLYRIGTREALSGVREAMGDADVQVRIAAARSAGLARDKEAVDRLMRLLRDNDLAVRRQAASALGQIGDERAAAALLDAADGNSDRFVEHAIIYALISINKPQLIAHGLSHSSRDIQRAALIALDQMQASRLLPDQVIPFLHAQDEQVKTTAMWVASRHPEWSADISKFIRARFRSGPLSDEEKNMYGEILASFCGESQMQKFIADELNVASGEVKILLLNAMARCDVKELPDAWVKRVGEQLNVSDPTVQASALQLVRLRKIGNIKDQLAKLSGNTRAEPSLRMQAIGALLTADPKISAQHFNLLFEHLQRDKQAPLRQQAATTLSQAELSEDQLLKIATGYLPQADAFITPRLVPVFEGATNSEVGKALARTLATSRSLDSFDEQYLRSVFSAYPADVQPQVDELIAKLNEVKGKRLERLQAMEKRIPEGNIERGRKLFFGKAACYTCHTVGPEGGTFGPDLTSIQRDRSAHDLLEAIVYPSVTFVREYETYRIKTAASEYTGVIRQQTPEWIELHTAPQTSVRIPRNEITSLDQSDISMMPQGLDQLLTEQEMSDLMAFLLGQDQDPKRDEKLLR
jgi:putative membrane-bound dehydrogenase-like protein